MNTVQERFCTWSEHCSAPRSLMSLGLKTPVSVGSPSLQPAPARKGGRCGSKAEGGLQESPPCLLPFLLSPFLYFLLLETLSNCEDRETPDSRAEGDLGWTFLPPPPPPPFLCEVFWVSSAAQKKSSVGGGKGGACLRENRVIHTQGRGGVRNPRRRGRHPSLSAGLEASCLCNRPSHSPLSGNQGDLLRPSQQESKTNPTKRKKPPEARPASLRCPP